MEVDASCKDRATWSLYYWAAHDGHLDILQSAADRSSDLTTKDAKGRTLLHLAADRGRTEAVKLQLDTLRGCQCQCHRFPKIITLLIVSLYSWHPEQVVRLLLQYQADLNLTDIQGNTPLHFAAMSGLEGTVKELLNRGAQRDVRNIRGTTPLISAIHGFDLYEPDSETEAGTEAVAHLLIESGVASEFSTRGGYLGPCIKCSNCSKNGLGRGGYGTQGREVHQAR